ncbi:B3 domain-containing protein Os01g0234100 [Populus alba]|uniref:B3 domain-containing protein n=2 Tax=Populus alba x Populus x berolinensis TaxID=444605 RepID=A0AAD6MHD3_9ROSI|nr:B3 domain-containing protein Os01g0234100-like [Populus alba]KAJ6985362.1 B3 domain-containing protein [Populus alba x Populus x berolinensis]
MAVLQVNKQMEKRGRAPKVNEIKKVPSNVSVKSESHTSKRAKIDDLYDNEEVKSDVMMRAKEIQSNLSPELPSIIKHMLPSNVTRVFWLHFPKSFCEAYLPKEDTMVVLEDERGKSYETKYLARKVGLSAGWRGFSIDHKIMEGDVLIFHLVEPAKFKVYIVRVNDSEEVDGALALLKLEAGVKQMGPIGSSEEVDGALGLLKLEAAIKQMTPINEAVHVEKLSKVSEEMEDLDFEHLSHDNPEKNCEKNVKMTCLTTFGPISDLYEYESEDLGSETTDGVRLSKSAVDFKEVKCFEDFDILANGLVINSELSKHLQTKYYELCCSQNSLLHDHLLDGLNCKLVVGMLSETINIADAIRASKLTTSLESFAIWEKTLKAFEGLGMNVGFLLARLGQLMHLSAKSKRYEEATLQRVNAKEEMKTLEAKLLEVKDTINRLGVEIEKLVVDSENLELKFQEVAKAPW